MREIEALPNQSQPLGPSQFLAFLSPSVIRVVFLWKKTSLNFIHPLETLLLTKDLSHSRISSLVSLFPQVRNSMFNTMSRRLQEDQIHDL